MVTLRWQISGRSRCPFVFIPLRAAAPNHQCSHHRTGDRPVEGEYTLANLPPGNYRIEVEKSEFKKLIRTEVTLHVQDALAIDFEMAVGSVSEIVRVEAGTPLVNTSDATVSTLVDQTLVENIPLNGRVIRGGFGIFCSTLYQVGGPCRFS